MLTMNFKQFIGSEDLIDYTPNDWKIYIVRDDTKEILYIGIARYGIFRRWFVDPSSHIQRKHGKLLPNDNIGLSLVSNIPESYNWKFDLLSVEEGATYLENFYKRDEICFLNEKGQRFMPVDLKYVEDLLIAHLVPYFNGSGNNNTNLPEIQRNRELYYKFVS